MVSAMSCNAEGGESQPAGLNPVGQESDAVLTVSKLNESDQPVKHFPKLIYKSQ